MKKVLIQAAVSVVVFFGTWLLLGQLNWMSFFKVEEQRDDLEEKLTEDQAEKLTRLQARIKDLVNLINTWLRVISVDINKIREQFEKHQSVLLQRNH